ncbi:MAG: CC/Se motif family (seleno)protein [Spiribacter sp.]|jgi:hypothetical protein|nr:CC/Se motif family (seleno)protein [Spiribacter sp.]MDR9489769.1 CC/Se motif family (seleno)protein [Spiribacter sp.]
MSAVTISPKARDWVTAQGGVITLRASPQHGCCGGHAALPKADVRVPDAEDQYRQIRVDGVIVHVANALSEGPYHVDLDGVWRWQRLVVEGGLSPWRPSDES